MNSLALEVGGALCIFGSALEVGGPAVRLFALTFLVACNNQIINNQHTNQITIIEQAT